VRKCTALLMQTGDLFGDVQRVVNAHKPLLFDLGFFFQAEDGIRDFHVTGVQTCALPISITYGAGRVIELQFTDETNTRIDWIDFNYAVALPCAFTNFVTCPVVPPENHLDFEVLAGEKRPARDVVRTTTYQPG